VIFTVYVLHSIDQDKHYTGYTINLELRLKSHNEFGQDRTAKYRPWRLIFSKEFDNKTAAREYEKQLKTSVGRDLIKSLNNDPNTEAK
jgi:putative endonuclease